jgi:2-polyprenyl-3-methyl-5-hydroxy-6-metoxy-1,4-benzoquinol methylase
MADNFNASYVGTRFDMLMHIPQADLERLAVLDVGCANGANGKYLRDTGLKGALVGVEYDPAMAEVARLTYDFIIEGDVESIDFKNELGEKMFDVLLFGDILEHLKDPQRVLETLVKFLNPGGLVIVSVPNMQHIEAVYNLAVKGYWPENDRGIFDKTHLRMFTKKKLVEMITTSGLNVKGIHRNFRFRDAKGSRFPWYSLPMKRIFPNLYTFQYVGVASKPEAK